MLAKKGSYFERITYCSVQILGAEQVDGQEFLKGADSEHLTLEGSAEVRGDTVGGLGERGWWSLRGLEFEGGDGAIRNAAGDDPVEVAEVGGDIEGESVGGHSLRDVNANGGNFLFADGAAGQSPDAGEFADALGRNAEVLTGVDEGFFDEADEVDRAKVGTTFAGEITAQVEDGVADELAGTVVRDVTAAVDLVDLDAFAGEELVGSEDVGTGGVAAKGQNGWVLKQKECVTYSASFARCDDLGLDAQTFGVGDTAEI
jgi:prepilin-type processing-associated H-X9-DG protein